MTGPHDPTDDVARLLRAGLDALPVPAAPGPERARRTAGRRAATRTAGSAALVAALLAAPVALVVSQAGQGDSGPAIQPSVSPAPSDDRTTPPEPTPTSRASVGPIDPTAAGSGEPGATGAADDNRGSTASPPDPYLGAIEQVDGAVLQVGTLAGFTPPSAPSLADDGGVVGLASWDLSPCTGLATPQDYTRDRERTGWWAAAFGAGDSGQTWQVATYRDDSTAAAAVAEIREEILSCGATSATVTTGEQSWAVSDVKADGTVTGGYRSFGESGFGNGTFGPQYGALFHIRREAATVTLVVTNGLIGTSIAVSGGDTRPETGAVLPIDEAAADRDIALLSSSIEAEARALLEAAASHLGES